ncbi:LRR receptor kinase SERK2 [Sesamum angolense]|uniref:LRR receptor kinase SERK2 n=1 Tax=Sesamum angolense TaxID=2727404 RepID=A0AAE2C515_9LAMI|nr:LRR receptor kinase SERK2 [Sesamum angolense]
MGECPIELRFEDLRVSADNFCGRNYVDEFQFGKVFHGEVPLEGSAQPSSLPCYHSVSPAVAGSQTIGTNECPIKLRFEDLRLYTDNFSDRNYLGKFQFGKVYHGKVPLQGSAQPKPVTVKIWESLPEYSYYPNENASRLMDEVVFLQEQEVLHPGLMKLYGYCFEPEKCGIVYDFKSFNTVANLVLRGSSEICTAPEILTWAEPRERPFLIRNISAAHIMVDEDWNPKLFDFGMITGGIFPDKTKYPVQIFNGCWGYQEPNDTWSHRTDEYAFGVVLLGLMGKEVYTDEDRLYFKPCIADRAAEKYRCEQARVGGENFRFSLVHKSFEADPSFCASDAPNITRLAWYCTSYFPCERPDLDEIVNWLQRLKVVRRHLRVYIEKGKRNSLFDSG